MEPSVVEEVRLTSFKSFTDAVLPLEALTLVVGRNGSGKSNALDGLWTLTRLASGEDVRDALDGRREGPALRGGAAGCAPFGESTFSLGCTVRTAEEPVRLDVTVQVEPRVQIVAETLRAVDGVLLATAAPTIDSADISAAWDDGHDGPHPLLTFRAGRLLACQVLARVPGTPAGQRIHMAAAQVLAALRSVLVLDPVPDEMRHYVPRRDVVLRRTAENLSAAVASLLEEPTTAERVIEAMSRLSEQDVVDVTISRSDLDDVMLTMVERFVGREHQVPARVMSEESLRFLAILVALLQAPTVDTAPEPLASDDAVGQTTLVIEELENGLHASQAQLLVGLVRDEVHRRRVQALATAHSPALLDALTGDEHGSLVICERDRNGRSTLRRLVDLPNYVDIVAAGTLGRAAEDDRLRSAPVPTRTPSDVLAEILAGPS